MVVEAHHHHRSTLKQKNKPFKSHHATKSALKDIAKGRTVRQSSKSPVVSTVAQARLNRRNTQKQAQAAKRASLVAATRIFNGTDGAPRIVAVIPLSEDIDTPACIQALGKCIDEEIYGINENTNIWTMKTSRFKTSLQFLPVPIARPFAALDAARAADYTLILLSPTIEVTPAGDSLLRMLQAQGLPTTVTAIPPTTPSILDPKSKPGILRSLLSFMNYFDPAQRRVFDLGAPSDALNALRALAEGCPDEVKWRAGRPWVVGESVEFGEGGVLKVTGVVRGGRLSPNRLVHVPNHGDYRVLKIVSAPIPRAKHSKPSAMDVEVAPVLLAERVPSSADSLVSTNVADDMANEQTWPTEEEMAGALHDKGEGEVPDAEKGTTPKRIKRIPKGMTEYQASWIVDESEDEDEEHAEGNEAGLGQIDEDEEMVPLDDTLDVESERKSVVAFQELDMEEEQKQLTSWRKRTQEEQDAQSFPDEIDTPQDTPARTRFARFRGLQSLRTSPWDPYENLPREYARIFEFEDFKRTERDMWRELEDDGNLLQPGVRVTIFIEGVPREASVSSESLFVLYGLLKHEHKKTVLHFTVQRNTEYEGSVRSKDPLILCYGPRRLRVNPVYSQHTRGGGKGPNNVHKFERFLWHGTTTVASVYAPIAFGKQPCMLLRETQDPQSPDLVAMGTFMNPDTTRIIAKRLILTGHPFKVHKKTATVRYMFFNPDDIQYYKPIQLYTKHGRTGHIRESLGTHGYFKAHFDGPINQMDTVCMSLYKRVYPRWSENWVAPRAGGGTDDEMEE
ncbi:ribosome biogenesis protein tsr1 [Rhizopogon salebrosus TDB-379]|nr:ribosome biogenesis protein tsr1 [Rhizopogon salebrosus TDB-379]